MDSRVVRLGLFASGLTFATFLYVPLLAPYLKEVLGASALGLPVETWLGIIFGAYPLAIILGVHAVGALSDDLGRRRMVLAGCALLVAAVLLYLLGSHPVLFVLSRVLEALGINAALLSVVAKVNDLTKEQERGSKQGVFFTIMHVGQLLGPLVGGLLAAVSLRLPLIAGGLMVVVAGLFFLLTKPDHRGAPHRESLNLLKNWRQFLGFRKLKGMAVLGVTMHASTPALIIFLPLLVLERFPAHPEYIGFAFGALRLSNMLDFVTGRIIDRYGKTRLTMLGCLLVGAALFLIPATGSLASLLVVMLLVGAGQSFWNIGAWTVMSSIGEANHIEGHIVGSFASIAKVGDLIASLAFGALAAVVGITAIFSLSAYVIMAGVLVALPFMAKHLREQRLPRA